MRRVLYSQARVFLQRPAAEALVRAHRRLRDPGYGLLLFDGYRPWRVTKLMWDATPPAQRDFVANPAQGSKHNRGCAIDLSLYQPRRRPRGGDAQRLRRVLRARLARLRRAARPRSARAATCCARSMEAEGFTVEPNEWWHFNCKDWRVYPILDVPFEDLPQAAVAAPR